MSILFSIAAQDFECMNERPLACSTMYSAIMSLLSDSPLRASSIRRMPARPLPFFSRYAMQRFCGPTEEARMSILLYADAGERYEYLTEYPLTGSAFESRLMVPGHIIPTENPQNIQPISPGRGSWVRPARI